ncbi:MmgE/PrpD family protein [Acuticoccus sp.]|uniref:MmgE/PrpD family protein n=1 Tax=Acuticoccus sp. TaxID=1904378 RepID=UPI003B51DFB3
MIDDSAPLAARIAAWRLSDDTVLPDHVRADAELRLLDTLGTMIVGAAEPLATPVRQVALAMGKSSEAGIIGSEDRASAAAATLANGTFAHATDFDDTHQSTLLHPSGPVVAAALAIAERQGADGPALLSAIAIGNEIACRLAMVAPMAFHTRGLHPTGVLGTFAAAVVAARLLRLSEREEVHALGICGSQAAGLLEAFADGTWVKTLHPGWAAHGGITAALLAGAGFTGPATVFEGRFGLFASHLAVPEGGFDFAAVTRDLGDAWQYQDNHIKLYPAAHVIHPFVDLAIGLHRDGVAPRDIARVDLPIADRYVPVVGEPRAAKVAPRTPTHARASLIHCVAAALVRGWLDNSAFTDAAVADPAVRALAERTHVCAAGPSSPDGFRGHIRVTLADDTILERRLDHHRGSRANPITRDDVVAKFMANAAPLLAPGAGQRAVDLAFSLHAPVQISRLLFACRIAADRAA